MAKKIRLLQKVFSIFTSFNLVLQSLFGILLVNPGLAFAQQETPTNVSEEIVQPTSEPEQETNIASGPVVQEAVTEEATTEEQTVEPTISLVLTEEPTTITPENTEPTPTPTQEEVQKAEVSAPPPDETGPPTEIQVTPVASPEPAKAGDLTASILENTSAESVTESNPEVQSNACLITDKNDYAPTDTVVITGTNFSPNKEYLLKITSEDEPKVNDEKTINTDSEGNFVYAYQLDGNYRPNYKVEVKDISGIVLSTIEFTDGLGDIVINEIYPNPPGSTEDNEFIELYNTSGSTIDISGWILDDVESAGSSPYVIPAGTSIGADSYLAFRKQVTGIALNNTGDEVHLRNGGEEIDSYSYPDAGAFFEGKSFGRCPNGTGTFYTIDTPTEAAANSCGGTTPTPTDVCDNLTGAIWTTDSSCNQVNQNLFSSKEAVYLNGGPQGGGQGLPDGSYYVKVTEPNGTILGDSGAGTISVSGGQFTTCLQIWDIFHYNDTTNPGGEYKVWVSPDPTFPGRCSKTDNFKIETQPTPTPTTSEPVCGDGLVNQEKEECDDGNLDNTDSCLSNCTNASCGDGYLWGSEEECDDGNVSDGDGCSANCEIETTECEEGSGWASAVVLANQGTLKNGSAITDPARTDPAKTLGANDGVFFSLGYGGSIILSFAQWVTDKEGYDLSFHEVTWGREGYPVEKARVYVSQNGTDWVDLGEVTNKDNGTGVGTKDLDGSGLSWIKYVKIVDTTDDAGLPSNADGYDLDAVDVVSGVCEEPQPEPFCGDEIKNGDEECDGTDGVSAGQFCTFSCKLINIYDGEHACPRDTTPVPVENYQGVVIGSQDADGETLSLTSGKTYLFKAEGTYGYGGAPANNEVNRADAGYATGDNWTGRLDNLLGIPSSAQYRGITSLLSDMGTGVFGLIDWGTYNADHIYQKVYTPTSDSVKFLISDWYDTWYSGDAASEANKNQGGIWDNSGNLTLNVYECKTLGSISGYKFNDLNGNGQKDGDDSYITYGTIAGGVTIFIDADDNQSLDAGEQSTNTDNSGYYEFTGLEAGVYDVCEVVPSGWVNTLPSSSVCHTVTLGAGENLSYDFGNKKRSGILACKYEDLDGDGVLDEGEPSLEDVTMTLEKKRWVCDFSLFCPLSEQSISFFPFPFPIPGLCNPFCHTEWQQDRTGQTGQDGCYLFDDLNNGDYRVSETVPEGFVNTTSITQGPVTIDNENGSYTLNFLNTRAEGSIGDFVWKDVNDDNVQDPGEPGIEGVLVKVCLDDGDGLWDPTKDTNCKTETTDSDGKYLVTGLLAGLYFAYADKTTLPGGGVNYDLSVGGVNPHEVDLGDGEEFLAADFGFAPPVSIKLSKTNDKPNTSAGEVVTYTLTINTGERDLSSMVLTDILPFGFTYQSGTATVTGGTVVSVEPTVSLLGKRLRWTWTAVPAYSTVVVTYQLKIDSGNKPACYTNFAFVWGTGSPTVVESAVVDSKVILGSDLSYNVEVGGEVLGVSTGEVLGASLPAAGSDTWYLILAFGLISTGLLLKLSKRTLKK